MSGIASVGEEEITCLRGSVEKKDHILTMIIIVQSIKCTRVCVCVWGGGGINGEYVPFSLLFHYSEHAYFVNYFKVYFSKPPPVHTNWERAN